jgi:hypothetical protein
VPDEVLPPLRPVPRIDAGYLHSGSSAVWACVVESMRPALEDELVKAARRGAFDCALNITSLCGRCEVDVDARWAAASMAEHVRALGIQASVERGESQRLGMIQSHVLLVMSWKGVAA